MTSEELLKLADELCETACEICNQGEQAKAYALPNGIEVAMKKAPIWAFRDLSAALNTYYEARHAEKEATGMAVPIFATFGDGSHKPVRSGPHSVAVTSETAGDIILELQDQITSLEMRESKVLRAAREVVSAQDRWQKDQTAFPGYMDDVDTAIEKLCAAVEETS